MIKISKLSKIYISKDKTAHVALKNINIKFNETGMVFVVGKSGSGKTTLLNIIGGLDKPDSGDLIIDGRSTKSFTGRDYDCYRNSYVGFIFQEFNLIESLNVEENIRFSSELINKKISHGQIDNILKLVGLSGLNNRKINELSGGQRQRVAIARILTKECKYIFADEPTGSLDTKVGKQIFELLKKMSKNKLVVIVSHDMESALKYADRIIQLKNGEIVKDVTRNNKVVDDELKITENGELLVPTSRPLSNSEIKKMNILMNKGVKKVSKVPSKFKKTVNVLSDEKDQFISHTPKITWKSTMKFAFSNIKVKISRFIVITFILSMALTIFGFSSFFSDFDKHVAMVKTLEDNGIDKLMVNKGRYDEKEKQLRNLKTIYTDDSFIDEYKANVGDSYLEHHNLRVYSADQTNLKYSLSNIEGAFHISSEDDLSRVGFSILSGEFQKNNDTNQYINMMITDVAWFIHCTVESPLLVQSLNSGTVAKFREYMGEDIENLNEKSKEKINNILYKIENNNEIVELTNTEKRDIFYLLRESTSLMKFVTNYFKDNISFESYNLLYKITGIIDTGLSKENKDMIDSIIKKNSLSSLDEKEKNLRSEILYYYSKIYADLENVYGFRVINIYSTVGSTLTFSNNINQTSINPSTYDVIDYNFYYKYYGYTHFLNANYNDLMLRNGYKKGNVNNLNNYEIISPYKEDVKLDIPNIYPSIKDEETGRIPPFKDNDLSKDTVEGVANIIEGANLRPIIRPIQINKKGLQGHDIIMDKNLFSNLFGADAITKYFVSQSEEDKDVELKIKIKLTSGAKPLEFRVVGIGNGSDIEFLFGKESMSTIALNNGLHDSYLIKLGDDFRENVNLMELIEEHNSYHNSQVSSVMYQIISIFGVFELVFFALTVILIVFVIVLISNFMNTSITRKTREIGLLRAMGVTKGNVNKIFLYESLLIAALSSSISILLCLVAVNPINELLLVSLPKYFGSEMDIELSILSFNVMVIPAIVSISIISSAVSTLIPTRKIGKIKPSESMRSINN